MSITVAWTKYHPIAFIITSFLFISYRTKPSKHQGALQCEKSSKDMASSSNLVSTIGVQASPKKGYGTRDIYIYFLN